MCEDMDGEYSYWGREYVQGYVTGCGVYKSGETATLKAVAGSGEQFDHWEVQFGNLKLTDEQRTGQLRQLKKTLKKPVKKAQRKLPVNTERLTPSGLLT